MLQAAGFRLGSGRDWPYCQRLAPVCMDFPAGSRIILARLGDVPERTDILIAGGGKMRFQVVRLPKLLARIVKKIIGVWKK